MRELALLFLRLGATSFGGPAAHIAILRDEVVNRRKWLSEQQFLDLLGATNLIPGPNSTEMAIHIGYLRGGMAGLVVAGACFILPAMLIVMALAWAYTRFGTTPQVGWLLYGIKPVVIAVIFHALVGLGKQAMKGPFYGAIGLAVVVLYLVGVNEIVLLFGVGLLALVVRWITRLRKGSAVGPGMGGVFFIPGTTTGAIHLPLVIQQPATVSLLATVDLSVMFLIFLKIGAILYGSGYVLLAFLRSDFVERLGWLSDTQLLDAVAVGQVTPGPLFTTATFIGYLLGGIPGGLLATLGIFLPAFVFVALTNPIIPKLRASPYASALLDGVNVASLGLMAGVTVQLGQATLIDAVTIIIALVTAVILIRFKINTTWLIAGGAVIGIVRGLLVGM